MAHTTRSSQPTGEAGPSVQGRDRGGAAPHDTRGAAQTDRAGQPAAVGYVLAALRLSLGWVFLWAFLDKTFGLGQATESADAWLDGGSPSAGFLSFAATGPFQGFYNDLAGQTWVDWLFMLGLLGIAVALVLGVAMRVAAASGALMLVMMWTAVLPPENNPFMDDHLVYALVLVLLAQLHAGRWLGFGSWWEGLPIVRDHAWLR